MPKTQPPTGPRLRAEDWLLYESLALCRGEKPVSDKRLTFVGYEAARNRGGSVNHADLAAGARSLAGEGDGSPIEVQCREETDFGLCEPWSRNEYGRWSMCGKLMHYRRRKSAAARRWLEHFWAGLILMSTYPLDARKNIVGMAGARSGKKGFHGVGAYEWLVAFSRGEDNGALRAKSNGQRQGPDAYWPEDYSTALCVELEDEIRDTAAPVWAAFRSEGWKGVLRFYRYGTRVGFRIVRTDKYLAVALEKNPNGNTPPTWVFFCGFDTGHVEWFPDTNEHIRQNHDGGHAEITREKIVAVSEFFGRFERDLPAGAVLYDVRTHPAGVTIYGAVAEPNPGTTPAPPDVLPAPSLSARIRPLDGGRFLLLVEPSHGHSATVRRIHADPDRPSEDRYVIEETA